jgi:hypothetical protein
MHGNWAMVVVPWVHRNISIDGKAFDKKNHQR